MNEETERLEVQRAIECNAVGKLKKLIDAGADIDVPNRIGITPLMYAVYNGHTECIKLLLTAGADINRRGLGGRSVLHFAIGSSNGPLFSEILKILIDAGADTNATDNDGWFPLHTAAAAGDEFSVRLLISLGTDIDPVDALGETPFHRCARNNHCNIVRVLAGAGADINRQDGYGNTPLHYAAANVSVKAMRIFLKAGSDLHIKNYDEKTALDLLKFNSIKKYDRYAGELCRLYDTASSKRLKKEDVLKAVRTGYEFDI